MESCPGSMVITMNPARSRLMVWAFPLSPQQDGDTALIWSAYKGHDQCLNLLIKAGARLDLEDNSGNTALANATHPECVALLEAANAP